jgi:hypothetical protein
MLGKGFLYPFPLQSLRCILLKFQHFILFTVILQAPCGVPVDPLPHDSWYCMMNNEVQLMLEILKRIESKLETLENKLERNGERITRVEIGVAILYVVVFGVEAISKWSH